MNFYLSFRKKFMERDGFRARISEREREGHIFTNIYKKKRDCYLTLFNLEFFILYFIFQSKTLTKKNKPYR